MRGKYVMTKAGPVLFPSTILHASFNSLKPSSAGMFVVTDSGVKVYGRSDSLDLEPCFDDAARIGRLFEVPMRTAGVKQTRT